MKVKIGVEKECLIFDQMMNPVDLDIDNLDSQLIVDFANHQLEIVTDPTNNSIEAERELNRLLSDDYFVDKKIWPLSTPLKVNDNVKYDKLDANYRSELAERYGIDKMLYSGIHYNYSNERLSTKQEYFQLIQNIYEYLPVIIQFTSFTPYAHKDLGAMQQIGKNYGFENGLSLRCSSKYGFSNDQDVVIDFSSLERFEQSKQAAINDSGLIDEREIYTKLRLKEAKGQNYIELRFLDINPFVPAGITDETLVFIESCLSYLTNLKVNHFDYLKAEKQVENVALNGRDKQIILDIDGQENSLYNHTLKLIDSLIEMNASNTYVELLTNLKLKYINSQLDIDMMCNKIKKDNLELEQFGMDNIHTKLKFEQPYPELKMELSTKLVMKEARKRGYDVSVESESQNILKITNDQKSQYVIQATKTNLDGYASVLLMNDKYMTKKILDEHNVSVPQGLKLSRESICPENFDHPVVVKPLDTNFGLGISICSGSNSKELNDAIANAFGYSDEIIIERYISGQEYRLLVIDDQVVSIVTRKNANVIGDGHQSIAQLIEQKNKSSLRGVGYKTPLEKIIIDDDLVRVISNQGYSLNSIIPATVKVLLRDTSNVSQGGDSHEVYDLIPDKYKQEAVKAAKALGVKICGVDMIIDFENNDHAIIEANFNPAIHMHMYPYKGRGKNVAAKVLDALFKK